MTQASSIAIYGGPGGIRTPNQGIMSFAGMFACT
jgi:hypothetical protein